MIALVCGDRYWENRRYLNEQLDYIHGLYHITALVEGEATGADEMSAAWAEEKGILVLTRKPWIPVKYSKLISTAVNVGRVRGYPALWDRHNKGAGPIRNKEMLDTEKPQIGVAFHDHIESSKGTKHMIELMKKASVPNIHVFSALKDEETHYESMDL